jgi:hypothetical protein
MIKDKQTKKTNSDDWQNSKIYFLKFVFFYSNLATFLFQTKRNNFMRTVDVPKTPDAVLKNSELSSLTYCPELNDFLSKPFSDQIFTS